MKTFQWTDDFSVGNEKIDAQHKKCFKILYDAHNKMLGNIKSDINSIGPDALHSMVEYTKQHFSFEEKYMKEIAYDGLDKHKKLHSEFSQRLDQITLEMHHGERVLNSEIIKVIENWLIDHIQKEDQKLKTV